MPQLGDRSNIVTETLSRKRPVVEIFPGAPIAPIVKRVPVSVTPRCLFNIVGELDGNRHYEIEVGQRTSTSLTAGAQRP